MADKPDKQPSPEQVIKTTTTILLILGIYNVVIGLVSLLLILEISMPDYYAFTTPYGTTYVVASIFFGIIYLVTRYKIKQKSLLAYRAAILTFVVQGSWLLYLSIQNFGFTFPTVINGIIFLGGLFLLVGGYNTLNPSASPQNSLQPSIYEKDSTTSSVEQSKDYTKTRIWLIAAILAIVLGFFAFALLAPLFVN